MDKEKGSRFYLNDGRLDLSMLDEGLEQEEGYIIIPEEKKTPGNEENKETLPTIEKLYDDITLQIEREYMSGEISATLEEIAMIFEEDEEAISDILDNTGMDGMDEFRDAFSLERIEEELEEFGMKDHNTEGDSLFTNQQFEYLQGKKLTAEIITESGTILASKNEIITISLLEEAKNQGKLMSIVLNHK